MDNIVYEHDYADEQRKVIEKRTEIYGDPEEVFKIITESGALREYNNTIRAIPKVVNPKDKENYEYLLSRLDDIARLHGGKIRGEIRYDAWEADINVHLPFFEFSGSDELQLLSEIGQRSHLVCFTPEENGSLRLHIMIRYFEDYAEAGYSDDLLEKIITSKPELLELFKRQEENKKAEFLRIMKENPTVMEFFTRLGDEMDLDAEAVMRLFIDLLSADSDELLGIADE